MVHKRIRDWKCEDCGITENSQEEYPECPKCGKKMKQLFGSFQWGLSYKMKKLEAKGNVDV